MAEATAPAINPLMDQQTAEYVTKWPSAINTGFVLTMAYLVFMMQTGFLLLTVGSVRARSARSVCVKNVADAVFGGVAYYLFGYAFAYGDPINEDGTVGGNGFIGSEQFALSGTSSASYYNFVFQFAFAITAATIVSGSVAERLKFEAYCLYSFFLTAWVYPVLSHWVWSPAGWASPLRSPSVGSLFLGTGVYDTVGSGAVHMLAGVAALWGSVVLGPRRGRFDGDGKPLPFAGHNAVFYCAGCLLLWFGFYGFNGGTAYAIVSPVSPFPAFSDVTARAALSTTLGACFGGTFGLLSGLVCHLVSKRTIVFDLFASGGGTLTGMVVVTSGCFFYQPWAAAVGGILGGLIYYPCSLFVLHVLRVDDPTDSFVIHGVAGALGVLWPSLLADKGFVHEFYGPATPNGLERPWGWFLGSGGKIVGANIVWILVIFGWTTAMMLPFFLVLRLLGMLRVSPEEEMQGVDVSKHGGSAYLLDDEPATMRKMSPTSLEQQLALLQDRVLVLEGAKATV